MLILPMLFGAFRPPKPENRILLRYALDGHGYIFSCTVIIFSAPGKDRGGSARCGLRWLKSSERHG